MSRIGRLPVELPEGVEADIDKNKIKITGPKGFLERSYPREVKIEKKDNQLVIGVVRETKNSTAHQGTTRAHLANMVKGVVDGWSKTLELVGVGYRAQIEGDKLVLTVGYSHPVNIKAPKGITFAQEKSYITIEGLDKELVGQVAAKIRQVRKPEPYKGKGIRYKDEAVRRKPGKQAAKTEGT